MSGDILAIQTQDILAGWELTGMKAAGLSKKDWFGYAVALDDTVIEFYNSRKTRAGR